MLSLGAPNPPARVAIVGAGGFVGAAIAGRMAAASVETRRLTRADVDLLTPDAAAMLAAHLHSEDALVLAAAIAPVKTPEMLRDNVALAIALADAVRRARPSHILNISSDAVYADSDSPLDERSPKAPCALHGVMHLAREMILEAAAAEIGAPIAHLRPTLIYGLADPHDGYGPNRFRRQAEAGAPISLFGGGEERRDHVWIADVAELACRMLHRRAAGALNAATGEVISFRALAEYAADLAERPVEIASRPRAGPMPHGGYRAFDPSGTRRAFPDFVYTRPRDGLAAVARQAAARNGAG